MNAKYVFYVIVFSLRRRCKSYSWSFALEIKLSPLHLQFSFISIRLRPFLCHALFLLFIFFLARRFVKGLDCMFVCMRVHFTADADWRTAFHSNLFHYVRQSIPGIRDQHSQLTWMLFNRKAILIHLFLALSHFVAALRVARLWCLCKQNAKQSQ